MYVCIVFVLNTNDLEIFILSEKCEYLKLPVPRLCTFKLFTYFELGLKQTIIHFCSY